MAEISKINVGGTEYDIKKDVFWATYGTTTGAEITAAVNAGKVVLCEKSDINAILPLVGTGENQYWFAGEYSDHRTAMYKTARAAIAKSGTMWRYSTTWADAPKMLDAVTDWSAQLVNGAIAWRYS